MMNKLMNKQAVVLVFSLVSIMIAGYVDMRSVFVSTNAQVKIVNETLKKVLALSELTRTEQLLRTDEIEWVQHQRRMAAGESK